MEKMLQLIKDNKIKILVLIILIISAVIETVCLLLSYGNRKYELTEVSQYKYYVLNVDGKDGVINTSGNIIVEPQYNKIKIPNPEKAVFICQNTDNTIVLNEKSEQIFTQYEEVNAIAINGVVSSLPYEKTVLTYKVNGKYGLINYDGKTITKPIYEEIKGLENKESELLVKNDEKYGVINAKGAKLIKEEYDEIIADGFYTEETKYKLSGYIIANKTTDGYRYGYINSKLKKVLDIEYNSITRILDTTDTEDVYIIACKNGQYGVLKNDNNIIPYSYQGIDYDSENKIFQIERNLKYGISNIEGKEIIPVNYNEIEFKGIYLKALKNDDDEYYYDIYGNEIKEPKYTSMQKTKNDNYFVTTDKEDLYGVVNKNKEKIIDNKYGYIEYLFEDYFIAENREGYLGVINAKDETLINFEYEVLQKIDDTKVIQAKVLKENKSDIYSSSLEKIYSKTEINVFKEDNYIKIVSNDDIKYLDFNGKKLTAKEVLKNNKLFAFQKENQWGFIDTNGNEIVDCKYDKVTEFNEYGFAGIKKGDKWGIIKEDGSIVLEPTYKIEDKNAEPEFLGKYYKIYYGYGESYYTQNQ